GRLHRQLLPRLEVRVDALDGDLLAAGQAQALGVLPGLVHERQHAHAHQVRAVDALEALGDDRLDAKHPGALGRPVAARAHAVVLAGEHHERDLLGLVLLAGLEDRRLLPGGHVDGDAALDARDHQVLQPDVGEGAAHHDAVVAAAAAVAVEVALLDAA